MVILSFYVFAFLFAFLLAQTYTRASLFVTALSAKLTVEKDTSVTGITLWKQLNVVTINVALNSVSTTAAWEVVATIPSKFRPSMEIAGFYDTNSNSRFVIDQLGKLMCGSIISNKAIRFTGTYIVD